MSDTQKTPEQLAAEQKFEAEKKAAEEQAAKEKTREAELLAQKAAYDKKAAENAAAAQKAEADKAAAALAAKKKKAGEVHFVRNGKVYVPIMPTVSIPGIGRRTALEICADEEAQDYLIREGCVGSVLKEI